MGDEDQRQAARFAAAGEHVEDLRADGGVEHRDGLVADQAVGLEHERGGDRHPLALPARELVRVALEEALGLEADVAERRADPFRPLVLRHALDDAAARRRSSRTRWRGLSVWYGSWKIICTRRRSSRQPAACRSPSSPPRSSGDRSPPCSPSIARASVDLPQPDSPTTPRISPRHQRDAVDGVTPSRAARGRPPQRVAA